MYNVYCDEIWPVKGKYEKYLFFIVLAVETQNITKLCQLLDNCRCLNDSNGKWCDSYHNCKNKQSCKEYRHKLNNSKIHFTELKNTKAKHEISRKWLKLLESEIQNFIKFNIFVVNVNNLDLNIFGEDDIDKNIRIYNTLFRTVIKNTHGYLLKDWKLNQFQDINQIYHHRGIQEQHFPFFNNISKLGVSGIKIFNSKLIFVSGHQEILPEKKMDIKYANTLIQFSDLILGSFRQLMYQSSSKFEVKKTANELLNIFEIQEKNQYKVKNKYRGFYCLNVWPNMKCDPVEIKKMTGEIIFEFPREPELYSHSIEFLASKTEPKTIFDFI